MTREEHELWRQLAARIRSDLDDGLESGNRRRSGDSGTREACALVRLTRAGVLKWGIGRSRVVRLDSVQLVERRARSGANAAAGLEPASASGAIQGRGGLDFEVRYTAFLSQRPGHP
jgi:hypothetical protein